MKNKEIKKMSTDEIKNKVQLLKKDLFNMRFKKVNSQLEDTAKFSQTKRNVAKLLTELKGKISKWVKKYLLEKLFQIKITKP